MKLLLVILSLTIMLAAPEVMAAEKLQGTDDRIKTLVYDPAEVYRIVSRAGFQTTLEFNQDEVIDTISIGDSIGWQLTPAGRRLFIKPLHKSGITNLSVITNRRSYQFEMVATSSTSMNSNHSYVVKFYYPDSGYSSGYSEMPPQDQTRGYLRPVSPTPIPQMPAPYVPPVPSITTPLPGENAGYSPFPTAANNYSYTMTGPDSLAPLKIYDNGQSTFFQFGGNVRSPQISVIGGNGEEYPLSIRSEGGMAVVDAVAPKMVIKQGGDTVFVYNEAGTRRY